jgi:hypothetical protein
MGRLPVVLANTIASIPASADGDNMVATSFAVRQNCVEKRFERCPSSAIVVSAIGMELCLKPSVWVTTSTRAGGSIGVGDAAPLRDPSSLEHDDAITPVATISTDKRPVRR